MGLLVDEVAATVDPPQPDTGAAQTPTTGAQSDLDLAELRRRIALMAQRASRLRAD